MKRRPFARRGSGFDIRAADGDEAEVLLYDIIGWPFLMAEEFVRELRAIEASTIHVRINSPGGDVFDGIAIGNALKAHPATVITHIDALAASIASVIALGGNEVRMADNAFFMIHDPWTCMCGDAAELRKVADTLDKIGDSLSRTYQQKTGASADQVAEWMHAETWFTAEEAEEHGFIDAIENASDAQASFDLSVFRHAPAALVASEAPSTPTKRDIERHLRDAGLSRKAAAAVVAGGWSAIADQRDADDETETQSAIRRALLARH